MAQITAVKETDYRQIQYKHIKQKCNALLSQSIAEEMNDASEGVSSEQSSEADSSRPKYQSTSQSLTKT